MTHDAPRTDTETAGLAHRDRRRAELLTVIRYLDRPDEAPARRPARARRALIPILAAAAVVGAGTTGWILTDDATTPKKPAAQGDSAPTVWRPGGQRPAEGVPQASAKPGDPVPWQLAGEMLQKCIAQGQAFSLRLNSQVTRSVEPPHPNPIISPTDEAVPSEGKEGGRVGPIGKNSMNWNQPEDSSAYLPYFTAWTPAFYGQPLRPLVVGKGVGPGLMVCNGTLDQPTPASLRGVSAPDGLLYEAIDSYNRPFAGTNGPMGKLEFTQMWGRARPNVARVNLVYPNGYTTDAVLRNGIWFSLVDTALLGPIAQNSSGATPTHVRVFDAAGTELILNPLEDPVGSNRGLLSSNADPNVCYRTPGGRVVARNYLMPMPEPEACRVAGRWNGTES